MSQDITSEAFDNNFQKRPKTRPKPGENKYDFDVTKASKYNKTRLAIIFKEPKETAGKITSDLKINGVSNLVMEKWINDTLGDAEYLNIPGLILEPEYKNPINRYGIDRNELTLQGIPSEYVDRIYRSLFVYSIGFC